MSTWSRIRTTVAAQGLGRADALRFECPRCGANSGDACIGRRKAPQPRTAPHAERYEAALKARSRGEL